MKSDTKTPASDKAAEFEEIIAVIERSRENAFRAVNRELISMYWDIGRYISGKCKTDGWGKSVVSDFSRFIQSRFVGIKGFSPQNIWRMKQFYETYTGNEKLSPLVREISWTNWAGGVWGMKKIKRGKSPPRYSPRRPQAGFGGLPLPPLLGAAAPKTPRFYSRIKGIMLKYKQLVRKQDEFFKI
jgi:hypothetical protein